MRGECERGVWGFNERKEIRTLNPKGMMLAPHPTPQQQPHAHTNLVRRYITDM
jgi:hypothetical protein